MLRDWGGKPMNDLSGADSFSLLEAEVELGHAMLQQAAARAEALFGPDHPEVSIALTNLGPPAAQMPRARSGLSNTAASVAQGPRGIG
jgi:hypothetical protein